jgi:iron complex transport system permease protein
MQTGLDIHDADMAAVTHMPYKKKLRLLTLAIIVLFAFSLCIRTATPGFYSPAEVFLNLKTWISINIAHLFHTGAWLSRFSIIDAQGIGYYESSYRLLVSVITFVCGMLLALAGFIFQSVFRNPMAAPSMLGVGTGVQVGLIIMVLTYGGAAIGMPLEKYKYCYIFAIAMLAAVMGVAKLSSGKRKFSVFDLLIVAAIVSQIVGGVTSYFVYGMDNSFALALQNLSNVLTVNVEPVSFLLLGIVTAVSIVPFFLMRFSFNAVCFDTDDSNSMGVNTRFVKFISLVLGSLMITAGMVHCGGIGMISLMVPFISRGIFGAESSRLFWGNLLIGGLILLLCRDIAFFIPFSPDGLPIGTAVEFVTLPVFVAILLSHRRTWE